ncbi:MAG: undecaprenyl-diphosphate phosphatase [Ruminococcaceae bacterium]|nr:undecaprenyl-diphosphate phosphatase [Oscillospiraceae bacterium]
MDFFIEIIKTILLGIVEGITEWLPISSTGHMILLNDILKLDVTDEFWEMFEVVIQLGAILAVVVLYFKKLWPFALKKNIENGNNLFSVGGIGMKKNTMTLWAKVIVAMLPAAVVGILFDDWFNEHFYNSIVVAAALIVYGVLFILVEKANRNKQFDVENVDDISFKRAVGIGLFQTLSLVPGTSRSGSTILGASTLSVSRSAAAEFSFFLAIPVMLGASALKTLKFFLDGGTFGSAEIIYMLVGCAVAFLVSMAAIKFLTDFVKKHSFSAFGIYRIVLGIIVIAVNFIK